MNELITKYLPKPSFTETVHKLDGKTEDIVQAIRDLDKEDFSYFQNFANQFPDGEEGYKQLHDFILQNVQYVADSEGEQLVKSPNRAFYDKECDCKGYSSIIATFAKCKGDKYEYEATSYSPLRSTPTHIYTTVIVDGKRIPIDPVYTIYKAVRSDGSVPMATQRTLAKYNNKFGQRKFYWHRQIIKGKGSSIAGFNNNAFTDSLAIGAVGTAVFLGGKYLYNQFKK